MTYIIICSFIWLLIDIVGVTAYKMHKSNKRLRELEQGLEEIRMNAIKSRETSAPLEPQEHELQGEFEADDDTYNRIVKEWIYGAEEEGGIDGEQRNTDGL